MRTVQPSVSMQEQTKYHPSSIELLKVLKNLQAANKLQGNVAVDIASHRVAVNGKDGMGSLIEEWFCSWATDQLKAKRIPSNTQKFPDFTGALPGQAKHYQFEVKSFHDEAEPAFDVFEPSSYIENVRSQPELLNVDFFVFSYLIEDSRITLKRVWLRKVWELCMLAGDRQSLPGLKAQVKDGGRKLEKIRPGNFHRPNSRCFQRPEEFIDGLSTIWSAYCEKTTKPACDFKKALLEYAAKQ